MVYFANPTTQAVRDAMAQGLLGCITTPSQGNRRPVGVIWCADNGCFGKGYPGDDEFLLWLDKRSVHVANCAFAVAPDVVGDAAATLERSRPFLKEIRKRGFKAAFVLQDGQEKLPVPWDEFDVAFIGGSTEWKLGPHARELAYQAKANGKWLHMGRVNSRKRIRYAHDIGCDSVDGTFLVFGPDKNLPPLLRWLEDVKTRIPLFPVAS